MEVLVIIGILVFAFLFYFFAKVAWFIVKCIVSGLVGLFLLFLLIGYSEDPEKFEQLKRDSYATIPIDRTSEELKADLKARKAASFEEFVEGYNGNLPFSVLKRFSKDGVLKISYSLYEKINPSGMTRIGVDFYGNKGFVNGAGEIYIADSNSEDNIMVIPF